MGCKVVIIGGGSYLWTPTFAGDLSWGGLRFAIRMWHRYKDTVHMQKAIDMLGDKPDNGSNK